jgi:hypothetical protein
VDVLRDWQDAPALVLSCPGPLRRHPASLLPLARLALPQVFLGGESQLLAFAAAAPALAGRLFFAPLPEMFSDPASLAAAWRAVGQAALPPDQIGHLRFGSVREARILKPARNAAVVAEAETAPPLTASHHPFASGRVVPAATERIFSYGANGIRPRSIGGAALPATELPNGCIAADLQNASSKKPARRGTSAGLDLVKLANYSAGEWAAGHVNAPAGAAMPTEDAALPARKTVLLPWNMAHFGSIVPELLRRLATLRRPDAAIPTIVIMPFNYLGLTGIIRTLIATLRDAAAQPEHLMNEMFMARITHLRGLATLKSLSRTAWIDGNDPEHWWTMARFTAAGFDPVLIDPNADAPKTSQCFPADDPIRVEADTRFGPLSFDASLPSLRALPGLLEMSTNRRSRRLA